MYTRYLQGSEIRAEETESGGRRVHGYAIVYNALSVDMGGWREMIAPGAFDDSIGGDVRAFWQHDRTQVLGRTGAGTLALAADDLGVRFDLELPDTQAGRDAYITISRGDVDGVSFGFNATSEDYEWARDAEGLPIGHLQRGDLLEVSPVTWPAYPATGVKARDIFGDMPKIPADLQAQGGEDSTTSDEARARYESRRRLQNIIDREVG